MHMQLTAALARGLAADGLSLPDHLVLVSLSESPDHRARLTRLAKDLGWEKSRLSHHIARMEARQLVRRTKCPSDRRGWFVELTAAGERALAAAAPAHAGLVRSKFIDVVSPAQLKALAAASRAVLKHLAAESSAAPTPTRQRVPPQHSGTTDQETTA